MLERPDQARFDHFSHPFLSIDVQLEEFCRQFGWTLTKNPHRQPGRDLLKQGRIRVGIGIELEGYWLTLDDSIDPQYRVSVCGWFSPVSDLFFFREEALLEHVPFSTIETEVIRLLYVGSQLAEAWPLPHMTEKGFYFIPPGWGVASPGSRGIEE